MLPSYLRFGLPSGLLPSIFDRLEHNIKTGLKATGWEGLDWILLAQVRDQWRPLVNTAMNLRIPQNAGNFLTS
jgi:hypothetical protein